MNVNSEVNDSVREKNIADRNERLRFGEATEERQLKRNEEKKITADSMRGIYENKQMSKQKEEIERARRMCTE